MLSVSFLGRARRRYGSWVRAEWRPEVRVWVCDW